MSNASKKVLKRVDAKKKMFDSGVVAWKHNLELEGCRHSDGLQLAQKVK